MGFEDKTPGVIKKAVRRISPRLKIKKPWVVSVYPRLN
jgi:hypothetical protein